MARLSTADRDDLRRLAACRRVARGELIFKAGSANGDVVLDIRLTHQEMADMIGSTRQSVTSALSALKRSGVLDVQDHHILIHHSAVLGSTSVVTPPAPAAR